MVLAPMREARGAHRVSGGAEADRVSGGQIDTRAGQKDRRRT